MLNTNNRIAFSVMLIIYIFLFPNIHAHEGGAEELIIEGDYIWFPKDYHANDLVITNSTGNIVVDQCEHWHRFHGAKNFRVSEKIEVADDEPFIITVDKYLIANYLATLDNEDQTKEGLYRIWETTGKSGNDQIDIKIKSFIKIKIDSSDVNCPSSTNGCLVNLSDTGEDCTKKLNKLPMHYFSNKQIFMLTESIYPETILINPGADEMEIKTIANLDSIMADSVPAKIDIMPLAAKIQYIVEYHEEDPHTSIPDRVRLRSIKIKPKQEKIRVNWRGR